MPYAYRKSERLRKNSDFVATMKGKRLSVDGLSLFYAPNNLADFRIGISVGKKLANSVGRHRIRRQMRDCIAKSLGDAAAGYDLVFVARQPLVSRQYAEICRAVEQALRKSALIGRKAEGIPQ